MELPDVYYYKPIYVETVSVHAARALAGSLMPDLSPFVWLFLLFFIPQASGNKVCKQSILSGAQNIILNGKNIVMEDCVIRGDVANIRTGRHCVISQGAVLHPSFKKFAKGWVREEIY
jgi:hypothetical protein